jgi:RIO kinase 1
MRGSSSSRRSAAWPARGSSTPTCRPYNLLWWNDRLVVIDFPQAVDVVTNPDAPDLLRRDLANVATWFGRRGIAIHLESVYAEVVTMLG